MSGVSGRLLLLRRLMPLPQPSGRVYGIRMPRPLTKSPPIGFRLPLDLYDDLQKLATVRGESPSEWVERNIVAALVKRRETDGTAAAAALARPARPKAPKR